MEVRQRQLGVLAGKKAERIRIVRIVDTVHQWHGLDADMSFAELRLIPKSNFLEQKSPLPLNNGKADWTWSGFEVWTDADVLVFPVGIRARTSSEHVSASKCKPRKNCHP